MARTRRALTPTGTLISNGGAHADGKLGRTIRTLLVSMFVRQQARPTVKTQNHDDLVALRALVEAGKITPVIDGTYPLTETPKAIERVASRADPGDDRHRAATFRRRHGGRGGGGAGGRERRGLRLANGAAEGSADTERDPHRCS
jgi:hypothetical protein